MPTVIRKSDGKVFDVFGTGKTKEGQITLILWELGEWIEYLANRFEPTHEHSAAGLVQERDHDPDLAAQ